MLSKSLRPLPFRPLRVIKSSIKPAITPLSVRRNVSLFPRSIMTSENTEFPPLLRLLDEFEKYSRSVDQPTRSFTRTITPKFDIKECSDSYELHGELPGIDQKNIEIEFTDSSTLTISGHTQRIYTEGQPPRIENENTSESNSNSQNLTSGDTSDSSKKSIEKHNTDENLNEGHTEKFWLMERNFGEFSRSFTFPTQVDENNVTATMNNGILKITVPKVKKQAGVKIQIQQS